MKAQCPIVPVALIDSYKSFDTGSIANLKVQVHFLAPIPYEEYQNMKSTEIAGEVKRRIEKTIQENGDGSKLPGQLAETPTVLFTSTVFDLKQTL